MTIDGAIGSRGAWLLEPYSDVPTTSGLNTSPVDEVKALVRSATLELPRIEMPAAYTSFLQIALAATDFGTLETSGSLSGALEIADDAVVREDLHLVVREDHGEEHVVLARLPGLGPRSARRAVLYLLKKRESALGPLLHALELSLGEKTFGAEYVSHFLQQNELRVGRLLNEGARV